jgi:hypothetical protein
MFLLLISSLVDSLIPQVSFILLTIDYTICMYYTHLQPLFTCSLAISNRILWRAPVTADSHRAKFIGGHGPIGTLLSS